MLAFFDRDREGVQSQLFINGINFSYIITEVYVQILASADIEGGAVSFMAAPNTIFDEIYCKICYSVLFPLKVF